jgi:hypothetical protein
VSKHRKRDYEKCVIRLHSGGVQIVWIAFRVSSFRITIYHPCESSRAWSSMWVADMYVSCLVVLWISRCKARGVVCNIDYELEVCT